MEDVIWVIQFQKFLNIPWIMHQLSDIKTALWFLSDWLDINLFVFLRFSQFGELAHQRRMSSQRNLHFTQSQNQARNQVRMKPWPWALLWITISSKKVSPKNWSAECFTVLFQTLGSFGPHLLHFFEIDCKLYFKHWPGFFFHSFPYSWMKIYLLR